MFASFGFGLSPWNAEGDWEGVPTVRGAAEGTPPRPSPALAGKGAKSSRLNPLLQNFCSRIQIHGKQRFLAPYRLGRAFVAPDA